MTISKILIAVVGILVIVLYGNIILQERHPQISPFETNQTGTSVFTALLSILDSDAEHMDGGSVRRVQSYAFNVSKVFSVYIENTRADRVFAVILDGLSFPEDRVGTPIFFIVPLTVDLSPIECFMNVIKNPIRRVCADKSPCLFFSIHASIATFAPHCHYCSSLTFSCAK